MEKSAVFPGGYGRIGEIQHGRLWPDWGLKGYKLDCLLQSPSFHSTFKYLDYDHFISEVQPFNF